MSSSYVCNWSEEINGKSSTYLAVCTEGENRLTIEATDENKKQQKIEVSLDSFKQLISWLESKLPEEAANKS